MKLCRLSKLCLVIAKSCCLMKRVSPLSCCLMKRVILTIRHSPALLVCGLHSVEVSPEMQPATRPQGQALCALHTALCAGQALCAQRTACCAIRPIPGPMVTVPASLAACTRCLRVRCFFLGSCLLGSLETHSQPESLTPSNVVSRSPCPCPSHSPSAVHKF